MGRDAEHAGAAWDERIQWILERYEDDLETAREEGRGSLVIDGSFRPLVWNAARTVYVNGDVQLIGAATLDEAEDPGGQVGAEQLVVEGDKEASVLWQRMRLTVPEANPTLSLTA